MCRDRNICSYLYCSVAYWVTDGTAIWTEQIFQDNSSKALLEKRFNKTYTNKKNLLFVFILDVSECFFYCFQGVTSK